ncbi:MAG: phage major capsid protein, partial [Clostridia bacterium]|nr:phage major capsid protein [Clostridia bacterium]
MRKDILKKKHERLLAKRDALKKRGLESTDAAEVRSITEQVQELNAEIEETAAEIAEIEAEEARAAVPPANAQTRNAGIVGAFGMNGAQTQTRDEPAHNTMEYRRAFMAYVQAGTPIPAELRAGDAISTADTGAAIPLTIMNEVINTVRKRYGNLYNKVRKTSVRGGVEYPIGALSASFKWINESTVSPRQKVDALAKVSFAYHTAEIRIAQTFVAQLLTLDSFEARLAEVIAIAYLQAMDYGIVNGNGNGQ